MVDEKGGPETVHFGFVMEWRFGFRCLAWVRWDGYTWASVEFLVRDNDTLLAGAEPDPRS